MIFDLTIILILAACIILIIAHLIDAEINISPILGVAVAILLSVEDIIEENEKEYYLQCCIFIISISISWKKKINV